MRHVCFRPVDSTIRNSSSFSGCAYCGSGHSVVLRCSRESNAIDETYDTSYSISAAMEASEQDAESVSDEQKEEEGLLDKLWNLPGNAVDAVVGAASDTLDKAVKAFNSLLEAFAIMVITACVIPVVVLILAIWLTGAILGIGTSRQIDALTSRPWLAPIREKRRQMVDAVNSVKNDRDLLA